MNLIELYKEILKVAKLTTDDEGYVSSNLMGNKEPFVIGGKRLVLPTSAQLRNPDRESRIVFHPLRENALQTGEPEVLAAYRNAVNTRLNGAIALLLANLVRIATSVAEHKNLNPDQTEYLTILKNADEKTFETLAKIISEMPLGQTKKAFVSIYLKKGAKLNDRTYKKAGIVSFPFYQDLLEAKDEVYGVKIRQKDKNGFKGLMEYVFSEGISTINYYSAGSSSDVAPSLESIMGAVKNIGAVINSMVENFKDVLEDHEEMIIDAGWVEAFENIDKFLPEIRLIPTQFGNDSKSVPVTENPVNINSPINTGTLNVPVKEKMTFAALPNSGNQFNQPNMVAQTPVQQPIGLGLVSQGGVPNMLSLTDAFRSNNPQIPVQNNMGFNQGMGVQGNSLPMNNLNNPFGFAGVQRNQVMGNNPFTNTGRFNNPFVGRNY